MKIWKEEDNLKKTSITDSLTHSKIIKDSSDNRNTFASLRDVPYVPRKIRLFCCSFPTLLRRSFCSLRKVDMWQTHLTCTTDKGLYIKVWDYLRQRQIRLVLSLTPTPYRWWLCKVRSSSHNLSKRHQRSGSHDLWKSDRHQVTDQLRQTCMYVRKLAADSFSLKVCLSASYESGAMQRASDVS